MPVRRYAASAFLLLAAAAPAQDDGDAPPVRWPVLPVLAHAPADYVPRGWTIEAQRAGDLDGDGLSDLAIILHQRLPANVLPSQGGGEPLDTNPRLLLIARGGQHGYRLLLANRTLIPRHIYGNLDDPLGELDRFAIRRGALVVPLHLFANMGGWTAYERQFTFRLSGGRAVLIGFDEQRVQRNTGETTDTSVNYLTRLRTVTNGSIEDDAPGRTRRTRLRPRPLLTIEQVGDGMAFEAR